VRHFWDSVVRPLLDAIGPATVVEIGAAGGQHTRLVAAHCREHGAVLHVIDPLPQFDVQALTARGGVEVHVDLSLNVLPRLPAVDVALIDGDHNWYTVVTELQLLQQAAMESGRPTPVILCHDVGWPCGRRDHYYDPESIPQAFRHPWARVGVVDGQTVPRPKDPGDLPLSSATVEGGPRNGVLTAIEDMLSESEEQISLTLVRRQYGVGILVPQSRLELHPDLGEEVARVTAPRRPSRRDDQVIPRVVHRIWLGPEPIPDIFRQYAESWREHHPEWELHLWRDETLPALSCPREYEAAENWNLGQGETIPPEVLALETWRVRYDIVRLEVLRQLGGVVVDMDVEPIRPLDPLLAGVSAFAGRANSARRVGNQVLGAVPRHPFFELAVRRLSATVGVARTSGQAAASGFLSRLLMEQPDGVTIFPRETFYSPLTIEPPRRPDDFPEIYAVHHHLESYRVGPEAQIARYERRLYEAQVEIARLERGRKHELDSRAKEQVRRRRTEARLEEAMAKIKRLSEERRTLRSRAADAGSEDVAEALNQRAGLVRDELA
jgi:hypothetical protein